jgi:phosphate transport system substrate-binding protein
VTNKTGNARYIYRSVLAGCAAAVALAACSSNKPSAGTTATTTGSSGTGVSACASGSISGAGSTFVQNIAQEWIKDFGAKCSGANINYQGVGSGAGVQQLTSGTVDFGATDVPMTSDQIAAMQARGTPVQIPWAAGAISLEYNVSGVTNLQLSPATIAGIFSGKIKAWDAQQIRADNPGVKLPPTTISTVHRSDSSGTTGAFTAYLAATAPQIWTLGAGKTIAWPSGSGAKGSDGVTATVKQTDGSIGYAEVSFAEGAQLPMAKVKNGGGQYVSPTDAAAVSAAISDAGSPSAQGVITPAYTSTDPGTYPISTVTYVVVLQKQSDQSKAQLLKDFLTYAVGPGQASATSLFYAPLPASVAAFDKTAIQSIG